MKAAQAPVISDMSVVASESGISASCEFANYGDKGEYVIQLYLYQVKGENVLTTVSYAELTPTGDGQGSGNTPWKQVDAGVYKVGAAVKRYEGGKLMETEFMDSGSYDVVKNGNSYSVTPRGPASGEEGKEDISRGKKSSSGKGEGKEQEDEAGAVCVHHLVYELVKAAETKQDALMAEQCEKCGAVFSYTYVPNSAYAVFLKEAAAAIENAEGEEVIITTDRWMSFNQEVLDAIAARPEVAVVIHYRYGGKPCAVTIPAGTKTESLADENGFCGFLYLSQLFPERK
ncbi:MAG: hypothetical protein NC400_09790 [Clostridium sp.]|nr:hypothetical protein [Clostridium sp.]